LPNYHDYPAPLRNVPVFGMRETLKGKLAEDGKLEVLKKETGVLLDQAVHQL
jgi:hypothetical protein